MDSLKTAARKVSEIMFPDIKVSYNQNVSLKSEEVLSSLPLQICLYYNSTYFPFWLLIRIGCFIYKFTDFSQLYKILITVIIIVMAMVETSRLYLGYVGNLTEKVPELAGFWMLTTFLQLPLQCLYAFSADFQILPIEHMTDLMLLLFIALEVILGYFAVKIITNRQALKFKLQVIKSQNCSKETFVD